MTKAKIYTKTGDSGKTSLLSGKRVSKAHIRIEAYGSIDELNSHLGYARSLAAEKNISIFTTLTEIQHRLFDIGSYLACDSEKIFEKLRPLKESDVEMIEKAIDDMQAELPPLKNFILPGGDPVAALMHVCRTVARRAERNYILLLQSKEVLIHSVVVTAYLNRLSDYLFVLARYINHKSGLPDEIWKA